ncbi:putative ribonuclease H-like domain-containing protein [Tanacetum coccineum]
MQDELLQFKLLKVWTLVDLPRDKWAIGTKWVFRNKKDERGIVVKNKARLVAQGHTQEEGIDYDKVFAPVARIEAVRLFLAFASFMNFSVYQMDVKSTFLYGTIEEEVYVCQPLGFVDPKFLEKIYKVEKALYGLHQAHRAWYETLSTYVLENGFHKGQIDKTLFIKRLKGDILLVQVYVDDIIFGSTKKSLCDVEQIMHNRFQMSSMGDLTFLLGYKVKRKRRDLISQVQVFLVKSCRKLAFSSIRTASTPMETNKALTKDEVGEDVEDVDVYLYRSMIGSLMYLTSSRPNIMFLVCACSRFQVQLKVSHLNAVKRIFRYLKGQTKLDLWYPKDSPLILEVFSDSDYACASLDRKSTIGDLLTKAFDVSKFNFLVASIGSGPRVNTLGSGEDSMKLIELMAHCTKLSALVKQKSDGIFISQDKYVAEILKKFDFASVKTASTLMETNKALIKDEEAEDVDVHLYRSMIGSLMYLTASRPDIMFAVCACARDSSFDLESFSDSDYAGASLDRKSTTGSCQFLGKILISWQCKKQTIVANSTTEAKYVAAANCCGQVLWIQN